MRSAFDGEYDTLVELVSKPTALGYAIMKPIFESNARRAKWSAILQKPGPDHRVRNAYDDYSFSSEEWLKPAFRMPCGLIPDKSSSATEIDFAFFVDRAMHMSISKAMVPSKQQEDRVGRDVVYYVDGVGTGGLSAQEEKAGKSGRKKSIAVWFKR